MGLAAGAQLHFSAPSLVICNIMSPVIDLDAERQEILRQYRRLLRTAKPLSLIHI